MIRDAGFEVEGNPMYSEAADGAADREFRLRGGGGDGEILKPDIAPQD
jgi:hypothetical protein